MSEKTNACQTTLRWYLYLLALLLPVKFSNFINGGEQANFPLNILEWLVFTSWPPVIIPIFCALPLLGAALLYPFPKLNRKFAIPGLSVLTFLAGLVGLCRSTELYYASCWLWHAWNISCLAIAIAWIAENDHKLLPGLLNTIAACSLLALLHGWYQHFWGLQNNLEMMKQNAEATGQPLSASMLAKLSQLRIYGNFTDPNTFAAHLLLTCPLMMYCLDRWSAKFEPRRISRPFFLLVGLILFAGALFWSGSRGALIGLAAGISAAIWLCPLKPRFRICLVVLGIIGAGLLLLAVNYASSRNLLSASVRLQYYKTSCLIFQKFPLTGAGLGEFFPWHMRLKPLISEEARDAHSMFFSLLGQCGLLGGLTAILKVLLPLSLILGLWKKHLNEDRNLVIAALSGWFAWICHSQFQFNDLVPSTCLYASFIALLAFRYDTPEKNSDTPAYGRCNWVFRGLAILAALLSFSTICQFPVEIGMQQAEVMLNKPNANIYTYRNVLAKLDKCRMASRYTPVPTMLLGELLDHQKEYVDAIKVYGELVNRTPHRASSYLRLARVLLKINSIDEAEHELKNAAEWYPANPNCHYLMALCKIQKTENNSSYLFSQLEELADIQCQLVQDEDGAVFVELLPLRVRPGLLTHQFLAALNTQAGEIIPGQTFAFRLAAVDIRSGQVFSETL